MGFQKIIKSVKSEHQNKSYSSSKILFYYTDPCIIEYRWPSLKKLNILLCIVM